MSEIKTVFLKLRGPFPITESDAVNDHYHKSGYRLVFLKNETIYVEITVCQNFSINLDYYDERKRRRWVCNWTDELGCNTNQLSSIYCFVYDRQNCGNEENYKSYFYRYNDNDERKDFVRYFHLGTGKTTKIVFSERRTYSLPFPEFGKYQDYLNFPYQEKFPELEEWPEFIFPDGEKPCSNIPIPHPQM